jgi:hypothetical protein
LGGVGGATGVPEYAYQQAIFYPNVVALAALATLNWRVQFSPENNAAKFQDVQIIRPAVVPDLNPPSYVVAYNSTGLKPALIFPVGVAGWLRIRAQRDVAGAGSRLVIRAEFGNFAAEAPGT